MQEPEQQQVDPDELVGEHAAGDLLGRADQTGLEPVVVLHQVLELAVGPHALLVRRRLPGLTHRLAEALYLLLVSVGDDVVDHLDSLGLGVADHREAVEPEPDPSPGRGRVAAHLGHLLGDAFWRVAVHEVPVADPAGHLSRGGGVAALEDLRKHVGLGAEGEVPGVEVVAPVGEVVGGPRPAQDVDELLRLPVALVVLVPGRTQGLRLGLEPA